MVGNDDFNNKILFIKNRFYKLSVLEDMETQDITSRLESMINLTNKVNIQKAFAVNVPIDYANSSTIQLNITKSGRLFYKVYCVIMSSLLFNSKFLDSINGIDPSKIVPEKFYDFLSSKVIAKYDKTKKITPRFLLSLIKENSLFKNARIVKRKDEFKINKSEGAVFYFKPNKGDKVIIFADIVKSVLRNKIKIIGG